MKRIFGVLLVLVGFGVLTAFVDLSDRQGNPQEIPAGTNPLERSMKNGAFNTGEHIRFRVHYGWIDAGTAEFMIDPKTIQYNGRECYKMHTYVKTSSVYSSFFNVKDDFHSIMDKEAILPHYYTRSAHEGDYRFKDTVHFNHANNIAKGTKGTFAIPAGTQDFMTAFYYARCLDLRKAPNGTVYRINTFLDDVVYNLGLTVIKREVIKTKFGKMRAIKIAPIMVGGRVFKDDDQMHIWVSDDDNLMPLRVESPILIGSIACDIIEYKGLRNPVGCKVKS
jgi:hypothetical protein